MNNSNNKVAVSENNNGKQLNLFKQFPPRGHKYELIEDIDMANELNDLHDVERDFIMIAGMSPQEARQASINVGNYDRK
jgi:hypothetical protein